MNIEANNQSSHYSEGFSFWFVFSLILNGYATGIPGISLGSVVFICLILATLFRGVRSGKIVAEKTTIRFAGIILISSLVGFCYTAFFQQQILLPISGLISGFAKFVLWALMSSVVIKDRYDMDSILKWLYRFAIILTTYMIIQNFKKGIYKREWFDNPVYAPFETVRLKVAEKLHDFLTERFGDYMKPPSSDRIKYEQHAESWDFDHQKIVTTEYKDEWKLI